MVPTDRSLSRLESAASRLNQASDRLNSQIRDLEERLSSMGVGVSLRLGLELCKETVDLGQYAQLVWFDLGYAKIDGKWRIAAVRLEQNQFLNDTPLPLVDAPRIVRCEAIPHLTKLVDALANRCEELANAVDQAISTDR